MGKNFAPTVRTIEMGGALWAWQYGPREITSELEREARDIAAAEWREAGPDCEECRGSGMDGLNPRTHEPVPCRWCGGTGKEEKNESLY